MPAILPESLEMQAVAEPSGAQRQSIPPKGRSVMLLTFTDATARGSDPSAFATVHERTCFRRQFLFRQILTLRHLFHQGRVRFPPDAFHSRRQSSASLRLKRAAPAGSKW